METDEFKVEVKEEYTADNDYCRERLIQPSPEPFIGFTPPAPENLVFKIEEIEIKEEPEIFMKEEEELTINDSHNYNTIIEQNEIKEEIASGTSSRSIVIPTKTVVKNCGKFEVIAGKRKKLRDGEIESIGETTGLPRKYCRTRTQVWVISREGHYIHTKVINYETSSGVNYCYICETKFSSKRDIVAHLKTDHLFKSKLDCVSCGESIKPSTGGILNHLEKHCDDSVVEFRGWGLKHKFIFYKDPLLNENVLSVEKSHKKLAECKLCYKVFVMFKDFEKHIHFVHKAVGVKCMTCTNFASFEGIESHILRKHKGSLKLNFIFLEKLSFREKQLFSFILIFCSILNTSKKGPFYCMKIFERTGKQNFLECEACELKFDEMDDFNCHVKSEHYEGEFYQCPRCPAVLSFNAFSSHLQNHPGCILRYQSGRSDKYILKIIDQKLYVSVEEQNEIKNRESTLCEVCGIADFDFETHSVNEHNVLTLNCLVCKQPIEMNKLKKHLLELHQDPNNLRIMKFLCSIGHQTTKLAPSKYAISLMSLGKQFQLTVNQNFIESLKCLPCTLQFSSIEFLNDHIVSFHNRDLIKCLECCAELDLKNIVEHIREVHGSINDKDFNFDLQKCVDKILYTFGLNSQLIKNYEGDLGQNVCLMSKKNDEMKCECTLCGVYFTKFDNFLKHITEKHIILKSTPELTCNICFEEFDLNGFQDIRKHYHSEEVQLFTTNYSIPQKFNHLIGRNSKNQIIFRFQKTKYIPQFKCCLCASYLEDTSSWENHIIKTHFFKSIDCYCYFCKMDMKFESIVAHLHAQHWSSNDIDFISHKTFEELISMEKSEVEACHEVPSGEVLQCRKVQLEKISKSSNQQLQKICPKIYAFDISLDKDGADFKITADHKIISTSVYSCNVCPDTALPLHSDFVDHLKSNHKLEMKIHCAICKFYTWEIISESLLINHLKKHVNDNTIHRCRFKIKPLISTNLGPPKKLDQETFESYSLIKIESRFCIILELKRKISVHSCQDCKKCYSSSIMWYHHIKQKHNELLKDPMEAFCKECNQAIGSVYNVGDHMKDSHVKELRCVFEIL